MAHVGEKMRQVAACEFRRQTLALDLTQVFDLVQGLAYRCFEIGHVDRFGDKVECAAVHGGANVAHVAVSRDDDRPHRRVQFAQARQQCQTVHHRHVDVQQY